ncbi:MAG: hypothetical protein VXY34_06300 [Bdellovibrionota bacterium]|nr:hypothetical protein [Bdellovibrionota bacterium]
MLIISEDLSSREVDNFTRRTEFLKDSTSKLNEITNRFIKNRIKKINKKNHKCKEDFLYSGLKKDFNVLLKDAPFLLALGKEKGIFKLKTDVRDSVYRDWNLMDSPAIRGINLVIPSVFGEVIKVNGIRLGVDKFEHFFGYGYYYFNLHYLGKKEVKKALKFGLFMEYFNLGAYKTGVMSYGDLAANFNGMRFWNHILAKRNDILNQSLGPYVKCRRGKWVVNKEVDWSQYVDDSFDEAINCSRFRKGSMAKSVMERVRGVKHKNGELKTCPLAPKKMKNMLKKYSRFSPYILNENGHGEIPKFMTWKLFHDL